MNGIMATTTPSILIVDDNEDIRELVSRLLMSEGFDAVAATDGDEMFTQLTAAKPDLILLDIMLPKTDGFELCRQLRSDPDMPPIIILTAKDQEIDRVVGLELGADDYIVKPFSGRELVARIKAVLRRTRHNSVRTNSTIRFAGWHFIPSRMEIYDDQSVTVPLSSSETALLLAFVQNPGVPMSRDRLLDLTKGRNSAPFDRSIDTHISRLRRKLGDSGKKPDIIKTSWGTGYIFTCSVEML